MISYAPFVLLLCWLSLLSGTALPQQTTSVYFTSKGSVVFRSDAPQELIKAQSHELQGALDVLEKTFSFKVRINSFEGFNGALQHIHFHENYMQTERYPEASFKGKIIEDIDWTLTGKYTVRAKGILNIHGINQERIIKGDVLVEPGKSIRIIALFSILLSDHNIPIPRIVKEKLAEEIKVAINVTLLAR